VLLPGLVMIRERRSIAKGCFFAGMLLLSLERVFDVASLLATSPDAFLAWQERALILRALIPAAWLAFSITYSRGNYPEFLHRWRFTLGAAVLVPVVIAAFFAGRLVEYPGPGVDAPESLVLYPTGGKLLNAAALVTTLLVLVNLERTFQLTIGTMRWRMKFLLVGLVLLFGTRVYVCSQCLLFSASHRGLLDLESGALLLACALLGVAHLRSAFSGVDVYPSRTLIERSATVILAATYLFLVGLLAQLTARWGGGENFQLRALVVLISLAMLGVLLLSDHFRKRLRRFISRNFHRPQYDFNKVWTQLTARLAATRDEAGHCQGAASLFSETFDALSVNILLVGENSNQLSLAASTAKLSRLEPDPALPADALENRTQPFDLESASEPWAEKLRELYPRQFDNGGRRLAVPLLAAHRGLGLAILSDRVGAMPYTTEEMDLATCIGGQLAAAILNLRLARELGSARELEAFQAMSAFLVHDLKNSASSLNLMLKNLPQHFENPEFREDALRGMSKATQRINDLIVRLGTFRGTPELRMQPLDLHALISDSLAQIGPLPDREFQRDLRLDQPVLADRDSLKGVITNLILNAHEAGQPGGLISLATHRANHTAWLVVSDNGCGMTPDFLRSRLFRPFQTTKKRGIGIGMFQARSIVEAHGGKILVESQAGQGTTFRISLPIANPPA
jgi:putative PEP-CTERM system histidine kinase